jgi:hypothetical protein
MAIGEQQDSQAQQNDHDGPGRLGEQRHPGERQPGIVEPVAGHHVEAGILRDRAEAADADEQPAEQVTRLLPGQDEAHHHEGSRHPDRRAPAALVHVLVGEAGQRELGHYQGQHQAPCRQRGRRQGQAEPADRHLPPRRRPSPPLRLAHTRDCTPATFRERYRSDHHVQESWPGSAPGMAR